MTKKVADLLVDVLAEAGVKRIYGVVGDSLNGITDSIRIKKNIDWVHVRHEEGGALRAGAEAQLTGNLAVYAGTCAKGADLFMPDVHPIEIHFYAYRVGDAV